VSRHTRGRSRSRLSAHDGCHADACLSLLFLTLRFCLPFISLPLSLSLSLSPFSLTRRIVSYTRRGDEGYESFNIHIYISYNHPVHSLSLTHSSASLCVSLARSLARSLALSRGHIKLQKVVYLVKNSELKLAIIILLRGEDVQMLRRGVTYTRILCTMYIRTTQTHNARVAYLHGSPRYSSSKSIYIRSPLKK